MATNLHACFDSTKRAFNSVPVLCRIPSTTVRYMRKVASAGVRLHHYAMLHVLRARPAGCIATYQCFRTLRPVDNVIISQEAFSGKTATVFFEDECMFPRYVYFGTVRCCTTRVCRLHNCGLFLFFLRFPLFYIVLQTPDIHHIKAKVTNTHASTRARAHTHTHTHARTHARTHASMHAQHTPCTHFYCNFCRRLVIKYRVAVTKFWCQGQKVTRKTISIDLNSNSSKSIGSGQQPVASKDGSQRQ